MKKAILLSLVFYGYQFLVSLLFVMLNMLRKEPDPMELNADILGLSSFLSGLLMTGHLLYCRDAVFGKQSFSAVSLRSLPLCLVMVLSAMFFLNVLSEKLDLPDWGAETFLQMSRNAWGILAMVLVAPFTEELLFRGAIERHFLMQGKRPAFAIVVSSLFFAVLHGNPAQMPFAFLIGLLLGWLYYRTGSIVPGVCCHIVNNGLAVISMQLFPNKNMTEMTENATSSVLLLLLSVGIFIVSFFLANKFFKKNAGTSLQKKTICKD